MQSSSIENTIHSRIDCVLELLGCGEEEKCIELLKSLKTDQRDDHHLETLRMLMRASVAVRNRRLLVTADGLCRLGLFPEAKTTYEAMNVSKAPLNLRCQYFHNFGVCLLQQGIEKSGMELIGRALSYLTNLKSSGREIRIIRDGKPEADSLERKEHKSAEDSLDKAVDTDFQSPETDREDTTPPDGDHREESKCCRQMTRDETAAASISATELLLLTNPASSGPLFAADHPSRAQKMGAEEAVFAPSSPVLVAGGNLERRRYGSSPLSPPYPSCDKTKPLRFGQANR